MAKHRKGHFREKDTDRPDLVAIIRQADKDAWERRNQARQGSRTSRYGGKQYNRRDSSWRREATPV
jgi:hypothetical protein